MNAMHTQPKYGWGWIDGEGADAGNLWIQISELDYSGDVPTLGDEELATIMLRNAVWSERQFPGITKDRENKARMIVNALNSHHELLEACQAALYGWETDGGGAWPEKCRAAIARATGSES